MKLLGFFFVGIGFIGIFLPLLPTTPFLLLALFLFVRSSPEASRWLVEHKVLGSYVLAYTSGNGLLRRMKARIIIMMWVVMAASITFFAEKLWMKVLLVIIGAGITIHVVTFRGKTDPGSKK